MTDLADIESPKAAFEARMVQRVVDDFEAAKRFMGPIHDQCDEAYEAYHNARKYKSMTKSKRFPVPVIQTLVDQFVAYVYDKLFYASKPCTVVGFEDTDDADAEAKQDMMTWQDRQERMTLKLEKFIRDAAMYPFCAAQVDFKEKTKREWQVVKRVKRIGPFIVDEWDEWSREPVTKYKGAVSKRLDPRMVFFGPDKAEMDDEFPIMVFSKQTKEYFETEDYFFNQDKISEEPSSLADEVEDENKREMLGRDVGATESKKNEQYIEWHGWVKAYELYAYEDRIDELTQIDDAEEMVPVVMGVVNGQVLVRLDENPLKLDQPNIIIGFAMPEEDELTGGSLAEKVMACHKGTQDLMGMLMANFHQSVNRMWVVWKSAILNQKPMVNEPGFVFETNQDVNKVIRSLDPPSISQDIYKIIAYLAQLGKDASSIQNPMQGKPDAGIETLGEMGILAGQAELPLRKALGTFETTFVEPLYAMRNAVNTNFIDAPYAYGIIGESAVEWRTIEPGQIRARVDFMCESSTRETNKGVIGQQLLQWIKLAPQAAAAGQPVRIDKMLRKFGEVIAAMKPKETLEFFPLIEAEERQGGQLPLDPGVIEQGLGNVPGNMPGNMPTPQTEAEAITAAGRQNSPQVRSV